MSWYDEKRDGPDKRYIEWAFGEEIDPIPDEPGFYRVKGRKAIVFDYSKEAKEAWHKVTKKLEAEGR